MSAAERIETVVGSVVAKKYRVLGLLGSGGMGAVYEAENIRTGRRVALKLLVGAAHDATTYARFLREARAAAKVDHPNVVQILDADQDADDGTLYIVQEFLRGDDLRRRLKDRGPCAPRDACELLVPVLRGLEAAHASGIVHRDIKPENVFLSVDELGATIPKVIDFGIAKLIEAPVDDQLLTRTGVTLGTPMYMSPEQARGQRDIDAQTDVWALGVLLYEMLSGTNPFAREVPNATIAAILMDPIDRVDEVAIAVPRALADVVHRAIERNRVRRYQSVAGFRDAIEDWMAGRTESRHAGALSSGDEGVPATQDEPPSLEREMSAPPGVVSLVEPRARGGAGRLVASIAAIAVASAVAVFGMQRSRGSQSVIALHRTTWVVPATFARLPPRGLDVEPGLRPAANSGAAVATENEPTAPSIATEPRPVIGDRVSTRSANPTRAVDRGRRRPSASTSRAVSETTPSTSPASLPSRPRSGEFAPIIPADE